MLHGLVRRSSARAVKDQPDLLDEFTHFLPDRATAAAAAMQEEEAAGRRRRPSPERPVRADAGQAVQAPAAAAWCMIEVEGVVEGPYRVCLADPLGTP